MFVAITTFLALSSMVLPCTCIVPFVVRPPLVSLRVGALRSNLFFVGMEASLPVLPTGSGGSLVESLVNREIMRNGNAILYRDNTQSNACSSPGCDLVALCAKYSRKEVSTEGLRCKNS